MHAQPDNLNLTTKITTEFQIATFAGGSGAPWDRLTRSDHAQHLENAIKAYNVALTIIDSFVHSHPGDEINQQHMATVLRIYTQIQRATGSTIWLVHHTPKSGPTLRGHTIIKDDPDFSIRVSVVVPPTASTPARIRLTIDKFRVDVPPAAAHFAVGTLESGTLGVQYLGLARDLEDSRSLCRETILQALAAGQQLCSGDLLEYCQAQEITNLKNAFGPALKALEKEGLIRNPAGPPGTHVGKNIFYIISDKQAAEEPPDQDTLWPE
jgi:hypothetical protein